MNQEQRAQTNNDAASAIGGVIGFIILVALGWGVFSSVDTDTACTYTDNTHVSADGSSVSGSSNVSCT